MCYLLLLWGWLGVTNCSGGKMELEGHWEGLVVNFGQIEHDNQYYLLTDGILFTCHTSIEESATTNALTAFHCKAERENPEVPG